MLSIPGGHLLALSRYTQSSADAHVAASVESGPVIGRSIGARRSYPYLAAGTAWSETGGRAVALARENGSAAKGRKGKMVELPTVFRQWSRLNLWTYPARNIHLQAHGGFHEV
jgi:hypothetical protein